MDSNYIDKDELNKIYKQYSNHLYYYALSHVDKHEIAECILQDSFVKLWENRRTVTSPYSFLKRTIKNLCINTLRDLSNKKKYEQIFVDLQEIDNLKVDDVCIKGQRIVKVLKTLPVETQRIIILKCVEGLKYYEISEDMDMPVDTVKYKLKVAYKKIREEVEYPTVAMFLIYIINFYKNN